MTSLLCLLLASATPPDIVVFLSDDHTATDSSVYVQPALPPTVPTPNMARIATAGMTMNAAYVASPSCAPSRAALLTGLVGPANGSTRNHEQPSGDIKKLPAYLQELGYEVVSFGKVAHYAQTPMYGFNVARHFGYHEDIAIPEAIKWLRSRQSDKPLCLMVGTNWPHVPWPVDTDFEASDIKVPWHHVTTPETKRARAEYYEAVAQMDRELGAVYDAALEVLGDETFFLHTSDHGAQWPFAKWNLLEEGVRTPMIAVWKDRIERGSRSDAFVSWLDILPTLVDVAGGDAPASLHGSSMLPVFTGQTTTHRDHIVTYHEGDKGMNVFPTRAIRLGDYKYIDNLHPEWRFTSHVTEVEGGGTRSTLYWPSWERKAKTSKDAAAKIARYQTRPSEQFFHLPSDPIEQSNLLDGELTGDQRQTLDDMKARLASWRATHDDEERLSGPPRLRPIESETPPNVIVIFADDMGQADLGCFGGPVETPNLDRLAAEGQRFTQFYVNSPICSPSRVALTTGQYPGRHLITSYLAHREMNAERGMVNWLDPTVTTLPDDLRAAGYTCGHFGKWHMGGQRDVGEAPLIESYGFAKSLTNFEGLGPRVLGLKIDPTKPNQKPARHTLGSDSLGNGKIEYLDRSKITGRFVEEAVKFIDAAAKENKPFYVNVWPDDVHSPFFPSAGNWPKGLPKGPERKQAFYDAVTAEMDAQLAPLFDRIRDDQALQQNTIIVFCSDNGPERDAGRNGRYRGGKATLYEGGIRSPLIVWAPGLMQPAAVGELDDESFLSAIDLVASLRPLCGLEIPDDADGTNLASVLLGLADGSRAKPLFWVRPPDRGEWPLHDEDPAVRSRERVEMPDLAIRDRNMKLLCEYDGSGMQMYDVVRDPGETNNLAKRRPVQAAKLRDRVVSWYRSLPTLDE